MSFDPALMLLLPKLSELLFAGVEFAAKVHDDDGVDVDEIVARITHLAKDWHPTVKGKPVLADPDTRKAGVRFLAGIACHVAEKRIRRKRASVNVEHDANDGSSEDAKHHGGE